MERNRIPAKNGGVPNRAYVGRPLASGERRGWPTTLDRRSQEPGWEPGSITYAETVMAGS
jgi:hypothetical protein